MRRTRSLYERVVRKGRSGASISLLLGLATASLLVFQIEISSQGFTSGAHDPGVRTGTAGAGAALAGLSPRQGVFFDVGKADFNEVEEVDEGMGPRMNLDGCGRCHSQPAVGGTSPAVNPQFEFATRGGASDTVPSFITADGPVREARFVRNRDGSADGGVHALFTISGRPGGEACSLTQPNFGRELSNHNVIFRIPTPVFGAGLIEQIPDSALIANQASNSSVKSALGIRGRPNFSVAGRTITGQTNNNGNDGTIARFGWKAQNKSLLLFSGEAYNVEMGITNELFQTERDETATCQTATGSPDSITDVQATTGDAAISSIEKFSHFMRFLAAPTPSATVPGGATSIGKGKALFSSVGCVHCHTQSFTTTKSQIAALSNKPVNLFSDLLIHDMGDGLADGISQGEAGAREFRSAPLWGLGQRIFFLHDGRTSNLITAIRAHASNGSEANDVVSNFNSLSDSQKQDLLNFLRSL